MDVVSADSRLSESRATLTLVGSNALTNYLTAVLRSSFGNRPRIGTLVWQTRRHALEARSQTAVNVQEAGYRA